MYRLVVPSLNTRSVPFRIDRAGALWQPRVADVVAFFQAQRDGADVIAGPLHRRPPISTTRTRRCIAPPRYDGPDSDVIIGTR